MFVTFLKKKAMILICTLSILTGLKQSVALPVEQAPTVWLQALKELGTSYKPRTVHIFSDGRPKYVNRLILETSPYLMQHAHNPVNWFPWGEEALKKAKEEDKPILLSIGYSTCHWCHVMERESFEDKQIAKYINANYIPIKVDREERPDLDDVYMKAVQALTGRGGWPMTTFLTPSTVPFFGGTYFPPRDGDRGRRKGFLSILKEYHHKYISNKKELLSTAQELSRQISQDSFRRPSSTVPKIEVVARAVQRLNQRFDRRWGGFGRAPKFPTPPHLELLLKYYKRVGDDQALFMLTQTLIHMAQGGIYDHIGGGFHRYATDQRWRIPHFEKMLYDNAQLIRIYLETAALIPQSNEAELFRKIARDTLEYLNKEMINKKFLYYSATDADSLAPEAQHPEEGLFFTWTPHELKSILNPNEYELIRLVYRITSNGDLDGRNIFHRLFSFSDLQKKSAQPSSTFNTRLRTAQQKLYSERRKRLPPLRDDKAITSWNALTISALVSGAKYLDPKYLIFAERTAQAIHRVMYTKDDGLKRTFMHDQARHRGVLDDYAFLIQAYIDLFEVGGNPSWLRIAIELQSKLDQHFWSKKGGYFMTSNQAEVLIARDRPSYDGAEPSGNSVAAHNLLRLWNVTGQTHYLTRSEKLFRAFGLYLNQSRGLNHMMSALLDYHGRARQVAIVIPPNGDPAFLETIHQGLWPNTSIVTTSDQMTPIRKSKEALVPWLKDKHSIDQKITAYLCYEGLCEKPVHSVQILLDRLREEPSFYSDRSPAPLTP